jgi:starvation-inducible outer membrane lipoprotein
MRKFMRFAVSLLVTLSLLAACAPTPEVVEKEVPVTVEVEVTRIVAGTPVVETVIETVVAVETVV